MDNPTHTHGLLPRPQTAMNNLVNSEPKMTMFRFGYHLYAKGKVTYMGNQYKSIIFFSWCFPLVSPFFACSPHVSWRATLRPSAFMDGCQESHTVGPPAKSFVQHQLFSCRKLIITLRTIFWDVKCIPHFWTNSEKNDLTFQHTNFDLENADVI